jgi:uncharacterized protein (TIGR00299 family) protein
MLALADLPAATAERSRAAFEKLAHAEARVHGCEPDDVHFHEVGALDSIVDIVGVSLGLELLGIDGWTLSPVAVGAGSVESEHGTLPVPAPATFEVLAAGRAPLATPRERVEGELTTPTGAVLGVTNAIGFGAIPAMRATAIGYGAGSIEIAGLANVLRLAVGEPLAERRARPTARRVTLLETNLDHISPEASAFAAEQLLAAGALDAWLSPIVMKKGRSAVTLSALVTTETAADTAHLLMTMTGTLGVRSRELERFESERDEQIAETPFGRVRYKVGPTGARPEADDVCRLAREQGRSFDDVARELRGYLG